MAVDVLLIILNYLGVGLWLLLIGAFVRVPGSAYLHQVAGVNTLLVKVSETMIPIKNVITIPLEITAGEFINRYFTVYGYHGYPVETDGNIIGMISYWGVREKLEEKSISESIRLPQLFYRFDLSIFSTAPTDNEI